MVFLQGLKGTGDDEYSRTILFEEVEMITETMLKEESSMHVSTKKKKDVSM